MQANQLGQTLGYFALSLTIIVGVGIICALIHGFEDDSENHIPNSKEL